MSMLQGPDRPMTDKEIKLDIPTLMYVANDLISASDALTTIEASGVLPNLPTVASTLYTMGQRYKLMAHEQMKGTKVPEPYQPPPVESKQTRRIRTKLDALQPLPKGTRVPPTPSARPRDFMAQAVSMALAGNTWPAARIRHVILHEPACGRWLLRQPPLQRIQETLSDHSRDPKNPRFIRVRQGWYKNNPKYKKAR